MFKILAQSIQNFLSVCYASLSALWSINNPLDQNDSSAGPRTTCDTHVSHKRNKFYKQGVSGEVIIRTVDPVIPLLCIKQ